MKDKDLLNRIFASLLPDLEGRLMAGVESLRRGEGIEGEQAFKRLRQRAKKRKKRGSVHRRAKL